ncbi:MAG: AI-2E family transporter [Anaerolineaceae bacterium]|nr:AI-2E family transporter [Anaerolineaceae bacterium]
MSFSSFKLPTTWTARRIILATVVFLGVVASFFLVFRFRFVLIDLFFAIVFSTAITPLVNWFDKHRVPRPISTAVTLVLIFAISFGFVLAIIPIIGDQWTRISDAATTLYVNFRNSLLSSTELFFYRLGAEMPAKLTLSLPDTSAVTTNTFNPFSQVFSIGNAFVNGVLTFAVLLLLTYYWSMESDNVIKALLNLFNARRRDNALNFIQTIQRKVGGYIQGLLLTSLIYGVASGITFAIIGLPYAFLLGLLSGVMNAIPLVGPIIGFAPAVLIALTTDPTRIIWLVIAFGVLQVLVNSVLYPRLMDQTVGVNPVVSLLAFAAFGSLFGIVGAVLAIPLAVVVQLVFDLLVFKKRLTPFPINRDTNPLNKLQLENQLVMENIKSNLRANRDNLDTTSDKVGEELELVSTNLDTYIKEMKNRQKEELK